MNNAGKHWQMSEARGRQAEALEGKERLVEAVENKQKLWKRSGSHERGLEVIEEGKSNSMLQ